MVFVCVVCCGKHTKKYKVNWLNAQSVISMVYTCVVCECVYVWYVHVWCVCVYVWYVHVWCVSVFMYGMYMCGV